MFVRSVSSPIRLRLKLAALGALSLAAMPAGAGAAQDTAANAVRVVGLGDSVMAAGGCPSCDSYLTTAARHVAAQRHRPAGIWNYARGGYRSVDVLHQLRSSSVRDAVRRSDVVVVEVGANDFAQASARNPACEPVVAARCFTRPAATMQANLSHIVSEVRQLQERPGAQVVMMGYWNVFKDGLVGRAQGSTYVNVSTQLTRWVNSMTWRVAREQHARYADAYGALKRTGDVTPLLLADGDHPNAAGHARLAGAVVRSLEGAPR